MRRIGSGDRTPDQGIAEMHEAAAELKFEYAARLRDEVNELRRELRDAG